MVAGPVSHQLWKGIRLPFGWGGLGGKVHIHTATSSIVVMTPTYTPVNSQESWPRGGVLESLPSQPELAGEGEKQGRCHRRREREVKGTDRVGICPPTCPPPPLGRQTPIPPPPSPPFPPPIALPCPSPHHTTCGHTYRKGSGMRMGRMLRIFGRWFGCFGEKDLTHRKTSGMRMGRILRM